MSGGPPAGADAFETRHENRASLVLGAALGLALFVGSTVGGGVGAGQGASSVAPSGGAEEVLTAQIR